MKNIQELSHKKAWNGCVSDTMAPGKESIQILKIHFLICKQNMEVGEIKPLNDFLYHPPGAIRLIRKYIKSYPLLNTALLSTTI